MKRVNKILSPFRRSANKIIEGAAAPPVENDGPPPATESASLSGDEAVLSRSRALWQEREPEDPSDPVAHVVEQTLKRRRSGTIVAASRRGRGHAHDGSYREDAFAVAFSGNWALAVVADGAGSKPLSRVGAGLACSHVLDRLTQNLRKLARDREAIHATIAEAIESSRQRIEELAASRDREPNDFACTLLIAAFKRGKEDTLVTAQIGDGGIAVVLDEAAPALVNTADRGEFAGETHFLTSRDQDVNPRIQVLTSTAPVQLIILGTDGVFDDFTPPFGDISDLAKAGAECMSARNPGETLLSWLAYERRGSFDDRTLVLIAP